MTPVILEHILQLLEQNSQITLKQMRESIQRQFNVILSNTCVAKNLEAQMWTVKKVTNIPVSVNSDDNKEKRRVFVTSLLAAMNAGKIVLFQDETNLNLFTARSYGRAPAGTRAKRVLPNSKGSNIHCIGLYSQIGGIIYFERRRGSFTKDLYAEWFVRMLNSLADRFEVNNVVVVIDNAPCHTAIELFINNNHAHFGVEIMRMAPYSAPLSPIEFFWSSMKAAAKRLLAERAQIIIAPAPAGTTQCEHRLQILESVIDSAKQMSNDNQQNPIRYYNHVQAKFPGVLALQDLEYGN
jgi:transposase